MMNLSRLTYMLIVLICLCIIYQICGCKHEEDPAEKTPELGQFQAVRDQYCAGLTDGHILKRCDRGTFAALANAFCPTPPYNMDRHEWAPGEHHRDIYPNKCFPDGSKSEISQDYFITLAHWWITQDNGNAGGQIGNLLDYLVDNVWIAGEGPAELTYILQLKPLFLSVQSWLVRAANLMNTERNADPLLENHNAYLTAYYIFAKARMSGHVSDIELGTLSALYDTHKDSPILCGLWHRYTDGDYADCMEMAREDCLGPMILDDGWWHWGSLPQPIACIAAVGTWE